MRLIATALALCIALGLWIAFSAKTPTPPQRTPSTQAERKLAPITAPTTPTTPTYTERLVRLLQTKPDATSSTAAPELNTLLAEWARLDPYHLIPELLHLHAPDAVVQLAVIALTNENPSLAKQSLEQNFPYGIPLPLLEAHYYHWPMGREEELQERLAALPTGHERRMALLSRVVTGCEEDPIGTWNEYRDISRADIDDECLAMLASAAIDQRSTHTLELLQTMRSKFSHTERWTHLAAGALSQFVETSSDTATALEWINETIPCDNDDWRPLAIEVIGNLLKSSPEKGRALLKKIADPELDRRFTPPNDPPS